MAFNDIAPIGVTFEVDTSGLRKAEQAVSGIGDNVTKKMGGVGKAAGFAIAAGVTAGLVTLGRNVSKYVGNAILSAEDENASKARLDNIAKSMGIFGEQASAVSKRLQDLADATAENTGVDDGAIRMTQAKLLTFKELAVTAGEAGAQFDRATMAAIDMASAGFGTAESNAVQLGKALNDPVKGISALTRSGITFNKQEQDRIKTLVQSNKMGEAQALVLKAIETQVGGTAASTAKGSDKMRVVFDNLKEDIGNALLPAMEDFRGAITDAMPSIKAELVPDISDLGKKVSTDLIPALIKIMPSLIKMVEFFAKNADAIMTLTPVAFGLVGAIKAVNVVTMLQSSILKGHPIIGLAAILIPLIAYLITLGIKTGFFTDAFKRLGDTMNFIGAVIGKVVTDSGKAIGDFFNGIFDFLGGMGETLYNFGKDAWQMFVQGALDALFFLPNLAADIIAKVPLVGEGLSAGIKNVTGGARQAISSATGTQNTGKTTQGTSQVNYYNVSAQGLTVDAVTRDAKRRSTLQAPVLGGA